MVKKRAQGDVRIRRTEVSKDSGLNVDQGVMVVITQAFCPNGHNLVMREDVLFDGYPGIWAHVEHASWSGDVALSPIHGDHSSIGLDSHVPPGTVCRLSCPVCREPFPRLGPCRCSQGGGLVGLYLRENCDEGDMVALCNIAGCYRSRIMDRFEILSEFVALEE